MAVTLEHQRPFLGPLHKFVALHQGIQGACTDLWVTDSEAPPFGSFRAASVQTYSEELSYLHLGTDLRIENETHKKQQETKGNAVTHAHS